MNSPMYDYAGSETNPLPDGAIPSQNLAEDLPVFVSDVNTQEVMPDLANANAKQMQAVALAGTLPNLYVGMHTGVANKINQSINEGIITKYALNGIAPVDAIQQELQTQEDLAKTTDEAVKNLSKADAELKAEQDKAKQIEQLILGTKYVAPSDQAYIQSIDQLAEMQKNAPVAPTLEQPELTTTDQALIFLAGLIGGNQQVPQAVQGAVAGAQQRAALANQMKTQRFNQEQQNYNRQLQAQQTIVGKEAQVFNQAQQTAGMNYRTELANLSRREIAQNAEVAKMRAQLVKTKQTDYDRIIKAYKDMVGRQTEYTPENVKAVESAKAYLIKQLGLPEESVNATLPSVTAGQKTLKGKVMEAKQKNDDARNQIAQSKFTLFQINNVVDMVNTFLKQNTIDGVLTSTEANNLNAMYDAKAAELEKQGVKNARSLFPVIDPFTTLQKQTADQAESNRQFMRNLAVKRFNLAKTKEARVAAAEIGGFGIDKTTAKNVTKLQNEILNSKLDVADAQSKFNDWDKAYQLNPKDYNTITQRNYARTRLNASQARIQLAEEMLAELKGGKKPATPSSPMLPPVKTPTNPTPNSVPNPTPKPQPTPKPTTPAPKPQFVPGGKIIVNGKEVKLRQ